MVEHGNFPRVRLSTKWSGVLLIVIGRTSRCCCVFAIRLPVPVILDLLHLHHQVVFISTSTLRLLPVVSSRLLKYPVIYLISQDSYTFAVSFWLRDQTSYSSHPRSSSTSSPTLLHLDIHASSVNCDLSPIACKPDSHTVSGSFHRRVTCRDVDVALHSLFPRHTQSLGRQLYPYSPSLTLRQSQSPPFPDKFDYHTCQDCI